MADELTPPPSLPQLVTRTAPAAIRSLVLAILSFPFGSLFTAVPAVFAATLLGEKSASPAARFLERESVPQG
jgi:hypothetical protein